MKPLERDYATLHILQPRQVWLLLTGDILALSEMGIYQGICQDNSRRTKATSGKIILEIQGKLCLVGCGFRFLKSFQFFEKNCLQKVARSQLEKLVLWSTGSTR